MYPAKRNPELEARVLEAMSKGTPLAQVCRDEGITVQSWARWCREDEELGIAHGHARDEGFDAIAADCLAIADETAFDTITTEHGNKANAEWISRSKLRVETRLKLLAKWDPKRYGDKVLMGSDPENPLPSGVAIHFKGKQGDA